MLYSRSYAERTSCFNWIFFLLKLLIQVNLTVDCTGWGSEHGVSIHKPVERVGSLVPRDSIGSASGLEPAMQAIFAFSHILRTRSKESIHSGESSDGRLSPSGKVQSC